MACYLFETPYRFFRFFLNTPYHPCMVYLSKWMISFYGQCRYSKYTYMDGMGFEPSLHFWNSIVNFQGCTEMSIWVFPKIGVLQNGWFIMENPIKMDDLGVPLFSETSIYSCNICKLLQNLPPPQLLASRTRQALQNLQLNQKPWRQRPKTLGGKEWVMGLPYKFGLICKYAVALGLSILPNFFVEAFGTLVLMTNFLGGASCRITVLVLGCPRKLVSG